MQVSVIFSNNKKIGSRLISWASQKLLPNFTVENCPSHVAVLLNNHLVVESTMLSGVRIVPFKSWKKINKLVVQVKINQKFKEKEVQEKIEALWNKKYDWFGILFFAKAFVLNFLFKKPFPKENKWQVEDSFFCTELAASLICYNKHNMTTPAKMCKDLLGE